MAPKEFSDTAVDLRYGEAPPLFLGAFPLTLGVQWICYAHFLVCLFTISTASSVVSIDVGAFVISPFLQTSLSTWSLVGVMVIVGALLSCRNRQEFPMKAYFYYNVINTTLLAIVFGYFFNLASTCMTPNTRNRRQEQRIGKSLTCGMVASAWFFALLAVLTIAGFATYTVWQLKEHLAQLEQAWDLLPHEQSHIKKMRLGAHLSGSNGADATGGYGTLGGTQGGRFGGHLSDAGVEGYNLSSMAKPGPQPPWNAVPIRSVDSDSAVYRA